MHMGISNKGYQTLSSESVCVAYATNWLISYLMATHRMADFSA